MNVLSEEDMRDLFESISKTMADKGRLIEFGFLAFKKGIPSDSNVDELRKAFICGAHYLFYTMTLIVDKGDKDFARVKSISDELDRFNEEFKIKSQPKG